MKYTTALTIGISLGMSLTGVALAQAPQQKSLVYLTPDQLNPSRLLPPPPADGSPVQEKEMAAVKASIKNRSAERYAQAVWDAEHEDATPFASAIGSGFDLTKLPATKKLMDSVLHDQAIAASMAKDYFHRKFPVTAEMPTAYGEWTCDKDDRKPASRPLRSYPSGHATLAWSVGGVLAALIPEKSQAILTRAADYAYSREVCGDHYHGDVEASHALGGALAVMFLDNAALKPQLDAARAELRAAHITSK